MPRPTGDSIFLRVEYVWSEGRFSRRILSRAKASTLFYLNLPVSPTLEIKVSVTNRSLLVIPCEYSSQRLSNKVLLMCSVNIKSFFSLSLSPLCQRPKKIIFVIKKVLILILVKIFPLAPSVSYNYRVLVCSCECVCTVCMVKLLKTLKPHVTYVCNVELIYHLKHRFHRIGYRAILRRKGENQRELHQDKRPRCVGEFIASQGPREINTENINRELVENTSEIRKRRPVILDDEWIAANPVRRIIHRRELFRLSSSNLSNGPSWCTYVRAPSTLNS